MDTLVQHGVVIERLTNQMKKMRKSPSSKKSVKALRAEVKQTAETGNLSVDMLIDPTHLYPSQTSLDSPTTHIE